MRLIEISILILFISGCDQWSHVTVNEEFVEVKHGIIYFEQKPFTGRVIAFGKNESEENQTSVPDTIKLYDVKNGKQHGDYQTWYENGALDESRYFKDGRKHGFHQKWYPDGQKAFEYHFDNGVYIDTLKEWYANGQMYLLSYYENGQQSGRQKAWRSNGELYLNYDIVNGRKYGNTGNKHCKSLWSEIQDSL